MTNKNAEQIDAIRKRRATVYDVAYHSRIHPEIPRVTLLDMFGAEIDALLAEVDRLASKVVLLANALPWDHCTICGEFHKTHPSDHECACRQKCLDRDGLMIVQETR
jgi:hypothetical protein